MNCGRSSCSDPIGHDVQPFPEQACGATARALGPRSLSDLGRFGCNSGGTVHTSPIRPYLFAMRASKPSRSVLALPPFRFRTPRSDRLPRRQTLPGFPPEKALGRADAGGTCGEDLSSANKERAKSADASAREGRRPPISPMRWGRRHHVKPLYIHAFLAPLSYPALWDSPEEPIIGTIAPGVVHRTVSASSVPRLSLMAEPPPKPARRRRAGTLDGSNGSARSFVKCA